MSAPRSAGAGERRRQGLLGVGLLLLFVGLFLAAGSIPNDAGHLVSYVGLVGAALLCVWMSGVLMGRASGSRAAPPPGG
jgi:hypothetical protein